MDNEVIYMLGAIFGFIGFILGLIAIILVLALRFSTHQVEYINPLTEYDEEDEEQGFFKKMISKKKPKSNEEALTEEEVNILNDAVEDGELMI